MTDKTIEIYYDFSAIPTDSGRTATPLQALDFRNAAMDLVEEALEEAEAGTWLGAEIGGGEVNFGFEVEDHARAEEIVREAVRGTDYDCIREIERHELTEEDMAAMEEMANQPLPLRLKLAIAFALPLAVLFLLFRLVTLPFRMIARRS